MKKPDPFLECSDLSETQLCRVAENVSQELHEDTVPTTTATTTATTAVPSHAIPGPSNSTNELPSTYYNGNLIEIKKYQVIKNKLWYQNNLVWSSSGLVRGSIMSSPRNGLIN